MSVCGRALLRARAMNIHSAILEFLESSQYRGTSEGGRLDLSGLNELRPGVPADRDYYGNGPLHFCVWHHNRDMFEHVL